MEAQPRTKNEPARTNRNPQGQPQVSTAKVAAPLRRIQMAPDTLRPEDISQLQRAIGNQAIGRLLQAKLKPGPVEGTRQAPVQLPLPASRRPKVQRQDKEEEAHQPGRYANSFPMVEPDVKPLQRTFVAPPPHFSSPQRAKGGTTSAILQRKPDTSGKTIGSLLRGFSPSASSSVPTIQRTIDKDGFLERMKQDRPMNTSFEEMQKSTRFQSLLRRIDRYNKNESEMARLEIEQAIASFSSKKRGEFVNSFTFLQRQLEAERLRLAQRSGQLTTTTTSVPPLREEPQSPFLALRDEPLFIPSLRPQSGQNSNNDPPPLRGGSVKLPSFRQDEPPKSEKSGMLAFRQDDSFSLSSVLGGGGSSKFTIDPPPLREEPQLLPQKIEEKGTQELVPYQEQVAGQFNSHDTQLVFLRLWNTGSETVKQKIGQLFSLEKGVKNLSGLEYVLEALDPLHRLEHKMGLESHARQWAKSSSQEYFFDWLVTMDRNLGPMGEVDYFDEEERSAYELKLSRSITYKKSKAPLDGENIYVLSQANRFYASPGGSTKKGIVHHSSFMAGQGVKGAGHMHFKKPGDLERIDVNSGHYKPKSDQMYNTLMALNMGMVELEGVMAVPELTGEAYPAMDWLMDRKSF